MITFHLNDGNPIAVNPLLVFYYQPADDGTLIMSPAGACVEVREPFDEVERRLKAWTKS
jgi:uncharacterized protein YlzI (FlbEa/FlbD family)